MVYYGALSKGCQRCRQRKIKCDQRKPGCLKCEKLDTVCPGYRDLGKVLFRDENDRIIRISRKRNGQLKAALTTNQTPDSVVARVSNARHEFVQSVVLSSNISTPLSQPIDDLGAIFFFTKYTYNTPPYSTDYHDWLTQSYLADTPTRAGIEAVGLAGISNTSYTPYIMRKSREKYSEAIVAVKQALNDSDQAIADSTLMAVLLLGVYEIINFETWDRFQYWTTHVKAITTLLQIRGRQQFTRERGVQLYIQSRAQILLACMQEEVAVPPALVQATYDFETSSIRQQWRNRKFAAPASISEISFRAANLRAALRNGDITDPAIIHQAAFEINADLEAWESVIPDSWRYQTIDEVNDAAATAAAAVGTAFDGKRHVYPNIWTVEIWNNWRILRIMINHIIVQNEARSSEQTYHHERKLAALSVIHRMSTDICISISSFIGAPRVLSLVQPLYMVCLEEYNDHNIRSFAVDQLRSIAASMGIRQAGLLADMVSKDLNKASRDVPVVVMSSHLTIACPLASASNSWK